MNHSYKKNAMPMYVSLYVVIHHPHVHHAICACTYYNSVKIVNVDCMLVLIVAHQSRSQRVIAERDLENSLLKGRRSRLKQYTSLIIIIVSIVNNNLCKACIQYSL